MVLGVSARLKSESLNFGKMTFINGRRGFMKTREFLRRKKGANEGLRRGKMKVFQQSFIWNQQNFLNIKWK